MDLYLDYNVKDLIVEDDKFTELKVKSKDNKYEIAAINAAKTIE